VETVPVESYLYVPGAGGVTGCTRECDWLVVEVAGLARTVTAAPVRRCRVVALPLGAPVEVGPGPVVLVTLRLAPTELGLVDTLLSIGDLPLPPQAASALNSPSSRSRALHPD
jgi:hypothetical protein